MKTKSTLTLVWSRWHDPGDYPNAVASAPLPSRPYIEFVEGECVIEFGPGEALPTIDELEELAQDECPNEVRVTKWAVQVEHVGDGGLAAHLTVEEFEER